MYNVLDVRNLKLYSDKKPEEIWALYRKSLDSVLDTGGRSRDLAPASNGG